MKLWGIGLLLVTSSVALSQSSLDKAKKSFSERDYAKASAYALAAVNENPKNSEFITPIRRLETRTQGVTIFDLKAKPMAR